MIQARSYSRRFLGVQYLRALAAMSVALLHVTDQIPQYEPVFHRLLPERICLWHGVDLFFVISGFIIFLTDARRGALDFMIRRLIRVVPLYWFLTTLVVIVGICKPGWFRSTVISGEYFAKSLFFVPYANPGQNGHFVPLLVPGWSLNLEIIFYVIFSLCLLFPLGWRIAGVGITFSILFVTSSDVLGGGHVGPLHFIGNAQIAEFWLGMVAGRMYAAGLIRMPLVLSLGLIMVGCCALFFWTAPLQSSGAQWPRVVFGGALPALSILVGTIATEDVLSRCKLSLLALIGDASYSIYLSQVFFLGAARMSWSALNHDAVSTYEVVWFAVYALLVVFFGGLGVYVFVERPLNRMLKASYRQFRPDFMEPLDNSLDNRYG